MRDTARCLSCSGPSADHGQIATPSSRAVRHFHSRNVSRGCVSSHFAISDWPRSMQVIRPISSVNRRLRSWQLAGATDKQVTKRSPIGSPFLCPLFVRPPDLRYRRSPKASWLPKRSVQRLHANRPPLWKPALQHAGLGQSRRFRSCGLAGGRPLPPQCQPPNRNAPMTAIATWNAASPFAFAPGRDMPAP